MKAPLFCDAWTPDVRALYAHDMREMWDARIARHIWNQYHNQLDIYLALAAGNPLEILDVGCAQATLALLLAERGHRVHALDIRSRFIEYARSRHERGEVTFVCADAMSWQPDRQFDLIFANQIVEHLVRPVEFATRLAGWLAPHGRLVMTTPNWAYVKNALPSFRELGDPQQYLEREFSADADGHFFAYTAAELLQVFRDAGLHRITVRFFETPWVSGHMRVRHLHRIVPAHVLRALDRLLLAVPVARRRFSHQLMLTGERAQLGA
jgi:2-polyprenyl-3-methyl-5-hydroxy-6-metoxy-1,4-benzoquinol methylase